MAKPIPFEFVIDLLFSLNPVIKPMFGAYGVYIGEKIVLILRLKDDHPDANGVWVATSAEHHASLKSSFPSLKSIDLLTEGKGESNWQMIAAEIADFEKEVTGLCELINRGDPRIGRIPIKKRKRNG